MYTYTRQEPIHKSEGLTMVEESSLIKSYDYEHIHRYKAFTEAMNLFDVADDLTRGVLLTVNEADQGAVMTALSNKLYQHIVDKVDEIDFGTIPQSAGDITKIDNYEELKDCINIISEIIMQYNQPTNSIDTIKIALQNMEDRIPLFTKAYKLNTEMPIIIYNTITLAIVSSVSYMISTCIEFIKEDQGFDIALNKVAAVKTKETILFKDLERFNKECSSGNFDKAMDYIMKQQANNFSGTMFVFGPGAVIAITGVILLSIIPMIRELIFFFYYSRTKVSTYFDAQSTLLTMNAYNIESNLSRDEKSRKEIAGKQKRIADDFKKIANFFKVEAKTAEQKTNKDISALDKQKYKANDVLDTIPDSANASLF